jgi:hypothetical protein
MANENSQLTRPTPPPEPVDAGHVPMTEEFDRAKWTLPPFGVVATVLVALAVVIGLISYGLRPKPGGTGSVDNAFAVALPGDNVLATIEVSLRNTGPKPLWVKDVKAKLSTDKGEFEDSAANAVDFDRYFAGYPDLREHSIEPLKVETRLSPGEQTHGSVIVSFPVTVDQFNARKSLTITVEPYDQAPIIIQK